MVAFGCCEMAWALYEYAGELWNIEMTLFNTGPTTSIYNAIKKLSAFLG
jgi:hypothetical protein